MSRVVRGFSQQVRLSAVSMFQIAGFDVSRVLRGFK